MEELLNEIRFVIKNEISIMKNEISTMKSDILEELKSTFHWIVQQYRRHPLEILPKLILRSRYFLANQPMFQKGD
jgi:hypothetical protein